MMKKLCFTLCFAFISNALIYAQADFGGPEKKKAKVTKKDITSADKRPFSSVQKKYQNQIVFSNSKIELNNEDPSSFVTTWQMGEPMYYRLYHEQSLMEYVYDYHEKTKTEMNEYGFANYGEITVVYLNGKEIGSYERKSSDETRVKTWVSGSGTLFDLNVSQYVSGNIPVAVAAAFQNLGSDFKEGTYPLEIKVYAAPDLVGYGEKKERVILMSSGKLNVKVTKEGMNKYAPFLCKELIKKPGDMVDAELEKQIMQLYAKEYGVEVLAVNIKDSDWTIKRNELGVILFRMIDSYLVYKDKAETNIELFTVKQDYTGSGFQKSVKPHYKKDNRPYCPFCAEYHNTH